MWREPLTKWTKPGMSNRLASDKTTGPNHHRRVFEGFPENHSKGTSKPFPSGAPTIIYYHSGSRSKPKGLSSPSFSSNSQLTNVVHFRKARAIEPAQLEQNSPLVVCTGPPPAERGFKRCFAPPCTNFEDSPSSVISSWLASLIQESL